MKQFCCGDVVPGCTTSFTYPTEEQLLQAVADHADTAHGIKEVPSALVDKVRTCMQDVPAV